MNRKYFRKNARQQLLYTLYKERIDVIINGLRVNTPNVYPHVLPHFAIQLDGGVCGDAAILRYSVNNGEHRPLVASGNLI